MPPIFTQRIIVLSNIHYNANTKDLRRVILDQAKHPWRPARCIQEPTRKNKKAIVVCSQKSVIRCTYCSEHGGSIEIA